MKGDFANWDNGYHLGVGNELSGDRPWQGLISLVAVFSRELSAAEIRQNFTAGLPDAAMAKQLTLADLNAREFETSVAPIISRHCLECHDASTRKGGLDLSQRDLAFKGGDSGDVLVAGKSSDSRLWQRIAVDEMPHDRTPLTASEKSTFKKWIDDGAEWRLAVIDPANYLHGNSSQSVFVQRLTVSEYVESVRSLLGVDVTQQAREILWGGPPDDALLNASEKNELTGDALKTQVARMLHDPRAVRRSKEFISEWLNLGHLKNLQPEARRFPDWNPELAEDMREETLAFFKDIVWTQRRPMSDLLNAQVTFATPRLARYYGLPIPDQKAEAAADSQQALIRFDLTNVAARGGLLTQGSTLTIGGDDASTVTRGLLVMHELLRGVVKDPSPCVDATPTPSQPGLTQRAIAEQRLANTSCLGCHAKFEPLSFGLEKFDGLGAFHEKDEFGNALREDGKILFPGESQSIDYQTSAELMNLLADSDRVKESITWKMAQFAVGRPLGAEDAGVMAEIHKTSQSAGGTWPEIMTAIVLSDLVQTTRTEPDSSR